MYYNASSMILKSRERDQSVMYSRSSAPPRVNISRLPSNMPEASRARFNGEFLALPFVELFPFEGQNWPGTYDAHLTSKNSPELWKFI